MSFLRTSFPTVYLSVLIGTTNESGEKKKRLSGEFTVVTGLNYTSARRVAHTF